MTRALVGLGALLALACHSNPSAPVEQLGPDAESYWPAESWRTASPAQVGVNASAIAGLTERLRAGSLGAEHPLVIVRKGYVIVDEYFASWDRALDMLFGTILPAMRQRNGVRVEFHRSNARALER